MKKVLKYILLFSVCLADRAFSQSDLKLMDKGIYKVWYSESCKNPVKVQYSVYHYKNNDEVNRKSMNFYSEKGFTTASTKDFTGNDYDKGHMCPAETFSYSKEAMKLTFSYLNCAVQYYELNRGLWNKLEHLERKWSSEDSLIVTVDVAFDVPVKRLPTGAAIPSSFRKTIVFYYSKKTEVYSFPNKECREPLLFYKVDH